MTLELVIRCKACGAVVDQWDLATGDPATHVAEIAGDLRFAHTCGAATADQRLLEAGPAIRDLLKCLSARETPLTDAASVSPWMRACLRDIRALAAKLGLER